MLGEQPTCSGDLSLRCEPGGDGHAIFWVAAKELRTSYHNPYSFIYPYCAHVYIKFLYSNPVFGWDLQEGLVSPRLWWYPGLREGTEGVSITTNVMVPDIYSTIYLTCTLKMIFAMMHA